MSSPKLSQLPDELRQQFEYIQNEIQPFLDDELYHQGISRLDVIMQGIPDDEQYRLLRGAVYARRAELLLELEDDEGAWELAQKAMNCGWYDASVYSIAGWAMYHMDNMDVAREQFDAALEIEGDRVSSLIGRALVLMELEEYDLARTDVTHAIHSDPDNPSAYAMRAEIHLYLGTVDSAERDIEKARRLSPDDPDYGLFHARLMTAAGKLDEALRVLDETVDDEEASLEALLLRSHLRLINGDTSGARKDAMRASNNFPDEAFAFVQLAHVQLAESNTALAHKAAQRAVKLDPSLPDGYMARASALQLRGDTEAAREDFERASQEPVELPMFLLGPIYDARQTGIEGAGFDQLMDMLLGTGVPETAQPTGESETEGEKPQPNPFEGMGGIPGMGSLGINPMKMLDQVFDDEGNVRGPFKPILKMAMKNAPGLLKSMPPGVLERMGGIDPEMLQNIDMSELSEEQIEQQMRMFYKMVKSGDMPMPGMGGEPPDSDEEK